jgi:hypothetical protein
MTTREELNCLYAQFEDESLTVEQALEVQWQISFLEQSYSAELEDFDCA